MENQFPQITLKDAISHITRGYCGTKGQEYLFGCGKELRWWTPSKKVVDQFKEVIGDKWNVGVPKDMIERDLIDTKIIFTGNYIVASGGGLCPSRLRLFELVPDDQGVEAMQAFIKQFEEDNNGKM